MATAPELGLPTTCGSLALVGSKPKKNAGIIERVRQQFPSLPIHAVEGKLEPYAHPYGQSPSIYSTACYDAPWVSDVCLASSCGSDYLGQGQSVRKYHARPDDPQDTDLD